MLIDRNDEVINICEIKYSSDEYAITDAYEETLRNRASLFKKVTKTKKALQHAFITTYGLKQNKYSGMIQSDFSTKLFKDIFIFFAAIAILPCNNGEIRTLNFPE